MGPVKYRPLKELGQPELIVELPENRTSITRIRVAIPAQLRAAEKLLEPKSMGLPDTATWFRSWQKTHCTGDLMEPHSYPKHWQFTIARILEQREHSSLRDLISMESDAEVIPKFFRGKSDPEVVLAENAVVHATRRGVESNVDSDSGDKVRDAV